MTPPLLLGHRGARKCAPENTFEAFDLALAHGCDGFEFDVRCTADQHMVICHDAALNGLKIARCLRKDLIAPVLDEVLERYGHSAFLDIEIKVSGIEHALVQALRQARPSRFLVSSFHGQALERLHHLDPTLPLGLIYDRRRDAEAAAALPLQAIVPHSSLASKQVVDAAHAKEQKVYVWTVNDERRMWELAEWGVDGILSDDTRMLARVFGRG